MPEKRTTLMAGWGERVMVRNYRRTYQQWELGRVADVQTSWYGRGHHNAYTVALRRRSDSGNYLQVTVGDEGIRRIENGKNKS